MFKAYDVRGLYPQEVTEELFRELGRAFVAYLGPGRFAVTRDMRLSSPSLTEAFIEGAVGQGGDIIDYGLAGTDQMYFAVAADGLDGGAQITASHNPKQYNGCKLVRREDAFPLSGESGIKEMKEMILAGTMPAPTRHRAASNAATCSIATSTHVMTFIDEAIDQAVQRRARRRVAASPGSSRRRCSIGCPAGRRGCASRWTARSRTTRPTRSSKRTAATSPSASSPSSADVGIAWDGDADRCFFLDGSGEFIAGDFITALLAEAFLMKHPGETIIYDVRASYAVKDIVARIRRPGADEPRRPCVHQAADARRGRDLRRRSHRALLLPRQLLRRQRLHSGAADPGADVEEGPVAARSAEAASREVLHLRRDQHQGREHGQAATRRSTPSRANTRTATSTVSTACRWSSPTGISTCVPSNTEPLLRLNLEGLTPEIMEKRRDEVLAIIRG